MNFKEFIVAAFTDSKEGIISSKRVIAIGGFYFLCFLTLADYVYNGVLNMNAFYTISGLIGTLGVSSTVEKYRKTQQPVSTANENYPTP